MYARKETIEEENLDWERLPGRALKTMDTETRESKISNRIEKFSNRSVVFTKGMFNIKKMSHFFDKNSELSFLFGIVAFAYIVGFCISYFLFYFYGGMPIDSFVGLNQNYLAIELWSIGAYVFITVWVIWTIIVP